MACGTHCCVLTRGDFLISDWNGGCSCELSEIFCGHKPYSAFHNVGNTSSAIVSIAAQIIGKENRFNPLDDTCARTMVEGVELTVTLNCASKENLLRALYSSKSTGSAGSKNDEFTIDSLSECDIFPITKHIADPESVVVSLRDPRGNNVYTLVYDVDYIFSKGTVQILRDDIDLLNAVMIRVAYNYNPVSIHEFEFLSAFQGYKSIIFKGVNYDSNEEALFDAIFPKVLFAPVSDFDLITKDGFLTLTIVGSVERDGDRFFRIIKQEG